MDRDRGMDRDRDRDRGAAGRQAARQGAAKALGLIQDGHAALLGVHGGGVFEGDRMHKSREAMKGAAMALRGAMDAMEAMEADIDAMEDALRGRCWCCGKGHISGLGVIHSCRPDQGKDDPRYPTRPKDCADWSFDAASCAQALRLHHT